MHRPIFGHSFAVLVAPILLAVLAFNFLNKKKTSARRNAEDVDTGASGSMAAPTETNSEGSSPSPTKANNDASSSMAAPTKTNSDGSSPSPTKANNGASSSLTGNCYEVFLSFRGPDTRHGFTDHLYKGLVDAGIDAFRDDDELCYGEDIRPVLMEAITGSKILIPIFSQNYGTSSWCLDELVQMMERKKNNGQIVLPIFYKVKPADVGHQIGSFGEAFHGREKRLLGRSSFDAVTSEKWKKALDEVSTLKGSEVELVKSIIRKVLNELKKKFELDISKNLVGIDVHEKKVMEFVDNKSHDTLFVGIHGMGGIGKTTLAKAIYNRLFDQFDHRSFIADIRESWKRNGIHYLQNQLIYDILKLKDEVSNVDAGTKFISSKFKSKKVLILLDDVDDVVQLQSLAGNRYWFSSGSKIIITTRNKRVLEEAGVDHDYEHKEMDYNQSLILFSKHAFRRDSPPREFEDLTHEAVSISRGLPLSLEVFGSLLCGKKSRQWRDTIKKLKKVPPKKVQEKLRISYEALDHGQKQIFLDIACLFIGTNDIIASYMWDACDFYPGEGIEILIFMSLIKVGDDHKLRMHDQLRDLGREIVREENQREPWCRSRLWDYEEAQKVLKGNKGTKKIEAINLSEGDSKGFKEIDERDGDIYTKKQLKNLTRLRFLHLKGTHLRGDFNDSMKELKLLRWQKCPMNFEVKNFHLKELVALELSKSQINEKWEGWSSFVKAEKLKYLNLSDCESLENTDFLSAFKKLEVLILNGCTRLKRIDASIVDMEALLRLELCKCRSLTELPAEIGELQAPQQLKYLDLSDCESLENTDFLSAFKKLEVLILNGCTRLKRIDASIVDMEALLRLELGKCRSLTELPPEIGKLQAPKQLKYLDLSDCESLENTDFLLAFKKLEVLILNNCTRLKRIDASIGDMEALVRLDLCGCRGLTELPAEIGELKALQQLLLEGTHSLSALPDSIGSLENLELLDISWSNIEELSNNIGSLRKLQALRAYGCNNLRGVMAESMRNLSSLQRLDFGDCDELQSLPDLPSNLTDLRVTYLSRKLPPLAHLPHLKGLTVWHCRFLECIHELPSACSQLTDVEESESPQSLNMPFNVEILRVVGCSSIETLDVSQFIHLRTLSAAFCKNLLEVRGLDKSKYLESLIVEGCNSIKQLDLPKFEGLKKLNVEGRDKLAKIQGLDKSEYWESLDIELCTSTERLDLPKCRRLKELKIIGCKNLAKIQGFDRLKYLESLDIRMWTSIERLDLLKFGRLKILDAGGCNKLAEIQGLNKSEYLEWLDINCCTSIERLDLPKSGRLKNFCASKCENLAEIQGLDRSEYLEVLNIEWCTSMERLYLPKSGGLKKLYAQGCKNLAEIQGLDRLEYLERLDINWCTSIERLDLLKSKRLKELNARDCKNLAEIQGLDRSEYLESLDIGGCTSIERLSLPKSESLKELKVKCCKNLAIIQGLDRLEYLESLDIGGSTSIERLDLPKFGRLKILIARDCKNLIEIQGLDRSEYLGWLDINWCTSIKRLDILKSGRLKELNAGGCNHLTEIQGLDRLEYLERLNINWCISIERLDLPIFGRLKELDARGCKNLAEIQGLDRLEYLERLDIDCCTSIERLDLPESNWLKKLKVGGCKNLTEIQGLDRLKNLESLDIGGCTSIERLDLPKFWRLKELNAGGCKNLAEIQGLNSMEYLESLDISRCTSIGSLNLPKSGSIKILYADSCKKLAEIQGLDRLESLERLDISGCTSLERLLLPKSNSLKRLEARDCENLVEIQGLNRLEFLEKLNIIGCKSLKKIPELSRIRIYRYYEITDGKTRSLRPYYMEELDEEYTERIHIF